MSLRVAGEDGVGGVSDLEVNCEQIGQEKEENKTESSYSRNVAPVYVYSGGDMHLHRKAR